MCIYMLHTPEGGDDPSKVCITIIDTIILTNYTNDAYTYDTYLLLGGANGAP
jgi:hypothetical protein